MDICISQNAPQPLYQQIKEQIEKKIMKGDLQPDENLPSIRKLADEIPTSIITVKRAYQELEREGWIYTKPGLGTFVARVDRDLKRTEVRKRVKQYLEQALKEARKGGLTSYEVFEIMKDIIS